MSVPSREQALFVLTFTAETGATDNTSIRACSIDATINGAQMAPGEAGLSSSAQFHGSNSGQFIGGPCGAGNYNFAVRYKSDDVDYGISVAARTLTVMRSKVG